MAQTVSSTEVEHPLAALTAGEIAAAVALVQADPSFTDTTRFAYVGLLEPTREQVRAWAPGCSVERRVRLMLVTGPQANVVEAVATPATGELSMVAVPGVRPGLLFEESFAAIVAVQENAQWQAAMRKRGIEDFGTVQIDPWPSGSFGLAHEEGRRICRCLSYVRHTPDDNGYAHPVEGVVVFVDMARRRGARGHRHRGGAGSHGVRQLLRRVQVPARGPEARRDLPARGPELHGGRQPRALAEVGTTGLHGLDRGPRPPRDRLRGPGPSPSHPLPGLGERDGGPLRGSWPHAWLEERLRRRRVGAGEDVELPHPGM